MVNPKKKKTKKEVFPRQSEWTIERVMMRHPLTISEDASIIEVCSLMTNKRRGQVSVVARDWKPRDSDERPPVPIGIFTERDLIRALVEHGNKLPEMKVAALMSGPVRTVEVRDDLQHAIDLMNTLRIRRLPVIDEGRLVGMMTRGRVMEAQRQRMVEMEEKTDELESRLVHDPLTGLANRVLFQEVIENEIIKVERRSGWLGLLMIDIDHFKRVNDIHGHLVGDVVLQQVSALLRQTVRRADLLARIGGEEFAVIVAQERKPDLFRLAEKLRKKIEENGYGDGADRFPITISIGASLYRADMEGRSGFMKAADANLYEAKQSGRNKVIGP